MPLEKAKMILKVHNHKYFTVYYRNLYSNSLYNLLGDLRSCTEKPLSLTVFIQHLDLTTHSSVRVQVTIVDREIFTVKNFSTHLGLRSFTKHELVQNLTQFKS